MLQLNKMNKELEIIKQFEPSVDEIVARGGMAAVSKYNNDNWIRLPIDGLMCVTRSPSIGGFSFLLLIINQHSSHNFKMEINGDLEIRNLTSFLMLKKSDEEVYCIQFYDNSKQEGFCQELQFLVNRIKSIEAAKRAALAEKKDDGNVVTIYGDDFVKKFPNVEGARKINFFKIYDAKGENLTAETMPVSDLYSPESVQTAGAAKDRSPNNILSHSFALGAAAAATAANQGQAGRPAAGAANVRLPSAGQPGVARPNELTKEDLKNTLIYLLENNNDFINKIHTAYRSMVKK